MALPIIISPEEFKSKKGSRPCGMDSGSAPYGASRNDEGRTNLIAAWSTVLTSTRRAAPCDQAARHPAAIRVSRAQLDAADQDRHDRGAEWIPWPGPFRAGHQRADPGPVQFRSASVGL